jgi:tetratricopeptide (TPR) repeat protein
MKQPHPSKVHGPAFRFGPSSVVALNRVKRLCGKLLLLLLTLIAGTLWAMAAQTGVSHAAAVRDHLQKAGEYFKANDLDSAAKEFDAVLALDPRNAEANANLGVIAFSQRDYAKASKYLRKALATDPSLTKSEALLGICQKRLGDPSALALLEKSFAKLKDKPLHLQVGMELAGLYDQLGDPGAEAVMMQKLVDLDSDNVDVLYMAQRLYEELADDTLNKLAVLAPGSGRMQQVIAERLVNGGDLKGAIEHYRKALEISPGLPGVRFELAEATLENSPSDSATQDEAEKELQTALATEGDNSKVQCELGRIAALRSDQQGTLRHYSRAFQLNPGNTDAQLGLARILMTTEKMREATKYLELAVQSDPLNNEAHYRLALAYKRLQMPAQAQKEMHLFQEIKKTKEQVAELYRQMNKPQKPETEELPDTAP